MDWLSEITIDDQLIETNEALEEWREAIRDWNATHSETHIIFGRSMPKTLEIRTLNSIVRHEKKLIHQLL